VVLTSTRSNLEPHPSDWSTQVTWDTSGSSFRNFPGGGGGQKTSGVSGRGNLDTAGLFVTGQTLHSS
jgi:hypothetical protein